MTDADGWTRERRVLAAGLILTITMLAFENLGVSTAMPVVAADLDGVQLYGWAFTATLLGSLIGIAVAGGRVDRYGPGRPYLVGLLVFATGLAWSGAAPTMPLLVAGRFIQGLGVGAVPAVVYAAIGRAFPERARARMFALMSTAWVVPGLVGPAISGTVAEEIGWRWVFLGVLPFVLLNAALTAPTLLRLGAPATRAADGSDGGRARARATVPFAILLAASAALLVGGLNRATGVALVLAAIGAGVSVIPLRRLLPSGTFVAAPGIPAAVATRAMTTLAFFTAQAFLPLTLTGLRDQPAVLAGVALTSSTVTWTAGAWLQDRRGHIWGRRKMVRRGLAILIGGVIATAGVIAPGMPVALAALTWSIAGLGMGMVYGGLSLLVLAEAAEGEEGRATSAMQLAEQLSVAIGTGLAGAAVAAAERADTLRPGLIVAYALAATGALLANLGARRLREPPETRPESAPADAEELVSPTLGFVPDAFEP